MGGDSSACGEMQNDSDNKPVEDGPLDPNKYRESQIKVLHLLKEPTEPNKSLRDALEKSGVSGPFWKVTAIRSYFIDNFWKTKNKLTWKNIKTLTDEDLYKAVLNSAIVNVSKIRGGREISPARLLEFAKENFNMWFIKQLQEYKPHIVICGGTYDVVVKQCIKKGISIEEDEISTGMKYFKTIGAFFLDCWHPSFYKCKQCIGYTYFAESVAALFEKEILTQSGFH
jgi:hypothetical protein